MSARRRGERGSTLFESLLAIALLGVAISIASSTLSYTLPEVFRGETPISAVQLARDLMEEILSKDWNDPGGGDGEPLGGGGSRGGWDDIDDYGGFSDSPPHDPTGNLISGASNFSRRVVVTPILGNTLGVSTVVARSQANFLKVEVFVAREGVDAVRLVGIRTNPDGVVPPPKSGLIYVAGSRSNNAGGGGGGGGGESMGFDLKNQTGAPIQISAVRVSWTPTSTVAFFRTFELEMGGTTGSFDAGSGPYAAAGQLLTLSQPVTIPAGGTAEVEIEHFRSNVNGTGPAVHPGTLAFTIFWTSGSKTYQTDIPVSG